MPRLPRTRERTSRRPLAAPRANARRARSHQLELFPAPVLVDALDPRRVAGARSRVRAVYLVRIGNDRRVHRVFDDRHGLYCEEHGPACEALEHIVRRRR